MALKHLTSGRWHWGSDFVGYTVEVYEAGTSTQKTTYSSSGLTAANTWPVTLDANGACQIWFSGNAKIIVKTPLGSVYETDDGINSGEISPVDTIAELRAIASPASIGFCTVLEEGRAGDFYWVTGDQSANVTADPQSGIWVAPDSAPTGASGAWKRIYSGAINVKWFGAKLDWNGTTGTDDTTAIQAAADQIESATDRTLYFPGIGKITSAIAITPTSIANVSRIGGITIRGDNQYTCGIYNAGIGYAIDFTGASYVDSLLVENFQVDTTTGGGVKVPQGGTITFRNYFQNGCAAASYGIYADGAAGGGFGIYMVELDGCRFWRNGGYSGVWLYLNSFHTITVKNCFISEMKLDGNCATISDGKNVRFESTALEGTNSLSTVQTLVNFGGTIFAAFFENVYIEGYWDTAIDISGASAVRALNLDGIFAWTYTKAGSIILDAAGANHIAKADNIIYSSDSTSTSANYIIHDPNYVVDLGTRIFNNSSNANQQARLWKQRQYNDTYMTGDTALGTVTNPTTTFSLAGQGMYLVNVAVITADSNHALTGTYLVLFDDASANDYTSTQLVGAQVTKGGSAPTVLNLAVNNAGTCTVTSTAASNSWDIRWGWRKISAI